MNMHEDMRAMLNPYLDNELHGRRLLEFEFHLATCKSCQNELKELRLVSDLLKTAPEPEFMPADRFVSNLIMHLPRRDLYNPHSKPGSLAWWLIPAGLMGAWLFVQTAFSLTNLVMAVKATGMFGQAVAWFGGSQQTLWFSAATSLFERPVGGVQSALSLLNGLNIFGVNLLEGFLWQALIVLLYWGWLFAWWLHRRSRTVQMENGSL
jgi:anti-sigma factor RsiW